MCIITYNKDGYTKYCKDYTEYWDWVEKRNESRYNDNAKHGKGFDGKNISHCHRLLDMAIEIGEGKGINVRRHNKEYLLSIRKGEVEYDNIVKEAEKKIEKMKLIYESSNLPNSIPKGLLNDLLLNIRYSFYNLGEYSDYKQKVREYKIVL